MQGCYEGQRDATLEWARSAAAKGKFKVSVQNIERARPNTVYWGGFHVGDARFLRSKAHRAYAKHMNELGGMYTKRWSDQLHYPLATQLLNEQYRTVHIPSDESKDTDEAAELCLMPQLFDPEGAACHTRVEKNGREVEICKKGDPSDVFLHEHRLGHRKDLWDRCSLPEDEDTKASAAAR